MLGLGNSLSSTFNGVTGSYNTTTNTKALHFDGTGDYLEIADDDTLSFTGSGDDDDTPFSIAFWIKRDSAANDGVVNKGNQTSSTLEYRIFWVSGNVFIDIADDSAASSSGYRRVYWANNSTSWQHMVFTYNGVVGGGNSAFELYVNGVHAGDGSTGGSDTQGMTNHNGTLRLGGMQSSASYQLGGEMCQYIMWNKALTQADVTYLYAGGAAHRDPTKGAQDYSGSSNVVIWLPLDADLNDDSGNGNNGTANGNAALSATTVPF